MKRINNDCSTNFSGYSGELKGTARALTGGEINLAKSVFGNAIDYSQVQIKNKSYLPGMRSSAPNGNLYLPGNDWSPDFSQESITRQAFFIHEMMHVQQQQSTGKSAFGMMNWRNKNSSYMWNLVPGQSFGDYGMEQQAEIVKEQFLLQNGMRSQNQPAGQGAAVNALVPFSGVSCP